MQTYKELIIPCCSRLQHFLDYSLFIVILIGIVVIVYSAVRTTRYIKRTIKKEKATAHVFVTLYILKKLISNSRGKYKRNECLINVCKSDTDLS
jgi:hypothetical protein